MTKTRLMLIDDAVDDEARLLGIYAVSLVT